MEKASLDRRSFLRLCVVTAGGAIVAACQQRLQGTEAALSPTGPASPKPVELRLTGQNQDAWTWMKSVQVDVSDPGECESIVVSANGREFEAQPDGEYFVTEVELAAGENPVTAICKQAGGQIQSDPVIYTARLRDVPKAIIQIELTDRGILLDGSKSTPSAASGAAIVEYTWSARDDNPAPLELEGADLAGEANSKSITVLTPATDGEYYLRLRVKDEAGGEDTSTIYFVVEEGQARVPDYATENPAWVETAIVYGVVPFLFGSPAFQAIGERLDDLADLGINALWLGPINVSPADDYGYAIVDYFNLNPAYGSKDDFRYLVEEAHARGIRVLMDFVPNHSSEHHPYFVSARNEGPGSPYWDFYDRDEQGNYTYYFQWTYLPNLNYDNPEVQRMMIEAFSYWVREFDVDGFRVDVAWGIEDRRPDFWPEWRRELKRIKPDLLLLAEASAREPYYFDNGFDAAYDWTYRPGGWAWEIIWKAYKFRLLAYNLTEALTNRPEGFHPDALVFRFLNNNDTGKRFITRYGEGVTRVATTLLLTLPGIPCIYTGDEYGLEFEPYQRLEPLTFEERYPGLREFHKRLIELRKETPSLHSRLWAPLTVDAVPQAVFSYIRYAEGAESPIIVLLNFSEEPAEFAFDLPEQFMALARADNLYDLLAEESVSISGGKKIRVSVPGWTARVLTQEPLT